MRAIQSSTSAFGKQSVTGSSGETPTVLPSGSAPEDSPPRWARSPLERVPPIHAAHVIASCAGLLHQAAGRPVEIQAAPPDLPAVEVCAEVLERILVNLVRNAGAATADAGSIAVSTQAIGGFVCVTVEDTGRGISQDQLARLKASPARRGTAGIGLVVVRMLAAGSGGAVRIISREGAGTRVEVFFPSPGHRGETADDCLQPSLSDPLSGGGMLWLHRGPAAPQPTVRPWVAAEGHHDDQHNGRARGGKSVSHVV